MNVICLVSALAAVFASAAAACSSDSECSGIEICAGTATKECADDPCEATNPCNGHGDCTTDKSTNPPTKTCVCTDGYGGDTCSDEPECTLTMPCTGDFKKCKEENGEQSVCVLNECGSACTLPDTADLDCTKLHTFIKCIEDDNKTDECVTKKADLSKIKAPTACTLKDTCKCQVDYWATDLTGEKQPCTALTALSSCLSGAEEAKGCYDVTKEDLQTNADGTIVTKECNAGASGVLVSSTSGIILAVAVAFSSM